MKKLRITLIIGFTIAFTSQLYFNFLIDGFRLSAAVIIYPILLITYRDINPLHIALVTALLVFSVRFGILLVRGSEILESIYTVYPGSLFYMFYGLIFKLNKTDSKRLFSKTFTSILMCDFISNVFEVLIRAKFTLIDNDFSYFFVLFMIAAARTTIVLVILAIIREYKILLTKEDHEKRYQNLIMLTSSLKSEIYFMKKNAESIENIMSNAYLLYERLSLSEHDDEIKNLSLDITKDVHEIKKDYIRVINGIETTLTNEIELSEMSIKDIFYILKETTYKTLEEKKGSIYLDFKYEVNFTTKSHFQLMSILRNLVNNSIEAMDLSKNNNFIKIYHKKDNEFHTFIIKDSGKGISSQNLNYIFNPGFSTKFDFNSGDLYRGIGLTHVKTLVNNHFNGIIDVSSDGKNGTEFEIKIPLAKMEV